MPRQHFNWKKKSEKNKFKYQNFLFLLTKHTQTLTKKKNPRSNLDSNLLCDYKQILNTPMSDLNSQYNS